MAVIGGGGAGLCASIAALEAGAEVFLISKTPVGYGNCTAYSDGAFSVPVEGVSSEKHKAVTLEVGRFINEAHMVESLSSEAPALVPKLASYGVPIEISRGRASVAKGARNPLMVGEQITKPLRDYARKAGVTFLENTLALSIKVSSAGPRSILALNMVTGEFFNLEVGAAVVATGGAGQVYGRTDNPARTTGDGYRLLYDVGVELQDMEFVQFYPLGFAEEGFAPWFIHLGVIDVVPLTNSRGERFLDRKLRGWGIDSGARANIVARDRCSIAVAEEIAKGEQVLLHLQELPEERWKEHPWPRVRKGFPAGRWPPRAPIKVAPTQHYFCGGARVGPRGETEVPGVFACGEVTGGTDGANRVGGNALSAIVVFGFKAGRAAAEFALSRTEDSAGVQPGDFSQVEDLLALEPTIGAEARRTHASCAQAVSVVEVKRRINAIADRYLGPVRDGAGLRKAVSSLEDLVPWLGFSGLREPREIASAFEVQNIWLAAYAIARSALTREESRGVHWRTDHPGESSEWARKRVCFKKGERGFIGCIRITERG